MIKLENIRKHFGNREVVRDVSLEVLAGEIVALVGENGAGKSTLMNIISGALSDFDGQISLNSEYVCFANPKEAQEQGIVMVHQELSVIGGLSISENLFLGHEPLTAMGTVNFKVMKQKASCLMRELGISATPDTLVSSLRIAEQQLVEIAKALVSDARVLILDEPTSALNEHESEKLFGILKGLQRRNLCILYISHHMEEVFRLADRIVVLRNGGLVADERAENTNSATVIAQMVGNELAELHVSPEEPGPKTVLRVASLWRRKSAERAADNVLDGVSFELKQGELLGLAGLVGAGRTELLEVLAGASGSPWGGTITLFGQAFRPRSPVEATSLGVAFVTEDRRATGLMMNQRVDRNITLACLRKLSRFGKLTKRAERRVAEEAIEGMGIKVSSASQPVCELSGGNQQKVVLSKWLAINPRLLLLDEPTRGIDVGAKAEIYSLLSAAAASGLSQIIASSDLRELTSLCHRILVFQEGKIVAELDRSEFSQEAILEYASYGVDESVAATH